MLKKERDYQESQIKAQLKHILKNFFTNSCAAKQTKDTKLQSQEMLQLLINVLDMQDNEGNEFKEYLKTGKISNIRKSLK